MIVFPDRYFIADFITQHQRFLGYDEIITDLQPSLVKRIALAAADLFANQTFSSVIFSRQVDGCVHALLRSMYEERRADDVSDIFNYYADSGIDFLMAKTNRFIQMNRYDNECLILEQQVKRESQVAN